MAPRGLLKKVDAVTVPVPGLEAGLSYYVDVLGHRLKWRNDVIGQAGLELPDDETELVLTTEQGHEPTWQVDSVDDAVEIFLASGSNARRRSA